MAEQTETDNIVVLDIPLLTEGPPAGWINPRRMVAAQTALVDLAGGQQVAERCHEQSLT